MNQPQRPTPFAVRCPEHGLVYLSQAEYNHQMNRPDALWRCPCGATATWDDDNYEARIDTWHEGADAETKA
jgi:hypothetical protein